MHHKTRLFITMLLIFSYCLFPQKDAKSYMEYYKSMYKINCRMKCTKNKDVKNNHDTLITKHRRRYYTKWQNQYHTIQEIDDRVFESKIMTENLDYILKTIHFFENYYSLPHNLLYAITIVESGRRSKNKSRIHPWPWTLNVEGKPYFFNNKASVLTFLKNHLNRGITNVDVGCGQVNWLQHKDYFQHPEYIVNPLHNIAYSAYLLRKHYVKTQSWSKAIGLYHSHTPKFSTIYLQKVRSTLCTTNNQLNCSIFNEYIVTNQNLPRKENTNIIKLNQWNLLYKKSPKNMHY